MTPLGPDNFAASDYRYRVEVEYHAPTAALAFFWRTGPALHRGDDSERFTWAAPTNVPTFETVKTRQPALMLSTRFFGLEQVEQLITELTHVARQMKLESEGSR